MNKVRNAMVRGDIFNPELGVPVSSGSCALPVAAPAVPREKKDPTPVKGEVAWVKEQLAKYKVNPALIGGAKATLGDPWARREDMVTEVLMVNMERKRVRREGIDGWGGAYDLQPAGSALVNPMVAGPKPARGVVLHAHSANAKLFVQRRT